MLRVGSKNFPLGGGLQVPRLDPGVALVLALVLALGQAGRRVSTGRWSQAARWPEAYRWAPASGCPGADAQRGQTPER